MIFIKKTSILNGFTLIELLVVMAIIGILSTGLIVAINPRNNINSANDSQILSDLNAIAKAATTYAASNNGKFASSIGDLVAANELTSVLTAPSGYAAYAYAALPSGCATAGPTYCTSVSITGELKSSKYQATPLALYCSSTGKLNAVATGTVCP